MLSIDKSELRRLIAENKAREALEQLRAAEPVLNSKGLSNQVTLLLSQWHACLRDFGNSLSAPEAYRAENQRISNALLQLIGELPEEELQLGLPPLPESIQRPRAPYTGLHWFTWDDAHIFFGREADIRQLYDMLIAGERVVLLYGQSGVGKSSLLHAGLLPRLEYRWKDIRDSYFRRESGLGAPAVLEEIRKGGREAERIIVLDQLEEMYTNPNPALPDEAEQFAALLAQAVREFPRFQFVLGFRKEFKAEIEDLLAGLDWVGHFLKPLGRQGVLEAIKGVAATPYLQRRYHLHIEAGLPEMMAEDILRDAGSNIAPLLQILLRKMWDSASGDADDGAVHFTQALYAPMQQSSLDALVDTQLAELAREFPDAVKSGLALDVLMQYTTAHATAGEAADEQLLRDYPHIPHILGLKAALQRLFLLASAGNRAAARLAHDALAPIIRKKYFDSDAPGQRARRIVETKEREIGFLASFSETDIDTILAGEQGMQQIPPEVLEKVKDDQARYKKQKQERFHLALDTAVASVEHLKYENALGRLQIAAQEGIYPETLLELARQLPFFFLQTGQAALFKESLNFIRKMDRQEDAGRSELLNLAGRHWGDSPMLLKQFRAWNPELYASMQARHFPEMLEIQGGTFQMGSEEGYADEKPVHEVSVSSFYLGATPVTFWQYGLFCLLTGKDLPGDSGFGRGAKPVINLNWHEAVAYCNWLTEWLSPLDGVELEKVYAIEGDKVRADWSKNGFRLPTEAEWEFAARAFLSPSGRGQGGGNFRFGNGKDIADPAEMNFDAGHPYNERYNPDWYVAGKGRGGTTDVKTFTPNALGLYDMSGNVYEWCWDWWSEGENSYYRVSDASQDPTGPESGSQRVVRGGSWGDRATYCRSAFRIRNHPLDRNNYIGFRVARRL